MKLLSHGWGPALNKASAAGHAQPIGLRVFRITSSPPSTVKTATDGSTESRHHRTAVSQSATMSAPSLAPFIMKRPWRQRWVKPLANWYCNAAGYRQLGLRYGAPDMAGIHGGVGTGATGDVAASESMG